MIIRRETAKRRGAILKEIEEQGQVSVVDLSKKHKVSTVSIRNDLNKLALQGLVIRTTGGALVNNENKKNKPQTKSRFADEASRLVKNGDTIMLPQSQYSLAIIDRLIAWNKRLTVITNSIDISIRCRGYFECILLGGKVLDDGSTLVDEQIIGLYFCDKLLIEVGGISLKTGLFCQNQDVAKMQRAMIQASEDVFVIAQQSDFNKKGTQRIANINQITKFICDYSPSPKDKSLLSQAEVKIIRVT